MWIVLFVCMRVYVYTYIIYTYVYVGYISYRYVYMGIEVTLDKYNQIQKKMYS